MNIFILLDYFSGVELMFFRHLCTFSILLQMFNEKEKPQMSLLIMLLSCGRFYDVHRNQ